MFLTLSGYGGQNDIVMFDVAEKASSPRNPSIPHECQPTTDNNQSPQYIALKNIWKII